MLANLASMHLMLTRTQCASARASPTDGHNCSNSNAPGTIAASCMNTRFVPNFVGQSSDLAASTTLGRGDSADAISQKTNTNAIARYGGAGGSLGAEPPTPGEPVLFPESYTIPLELGGTGPTGPEAPTDPKFPAKSTAHTLNEGQSPSAFSQREILRAHLRAHRAFLPHRLIRASRKPATSSLISRPIPRLRSRP